MLSLPPSLRTLSGHLRALIPDGPDAWRIPSPSGRVVRLVPDPRAPGAAWRVTTADGARPPSELRATFVREGSQWVPASDDVRQTWRPVRRSVEARGHAWTVRVAPDGVEIRPKGRRTGALSIPWETILACAERHAAAPIPAARPRRGRGG